jgi:excisionase family DNA binding protein
MSARTPETEPLLTPAEVATMFRVDPKTVTRWAKAGKLTSIRTLGGHRRYRETEVRALLAGVPQAHSELWSTVNRQQAMGPSSTA